MEDDFLPGGYLDADVNPYTGERITSIDSRGWVDASSSDLHKQMMVLEKRLMIAQTLGKMDIAKQLSVAIAQIKAAIDAAIKRDARRPVRKRPNSYEPQRSTTRYTD